MSEVIERPMESTALMVIPPSALPVILQADGAADILSELAKRVAAFKSDASTEPGREAIKSMRYHIRRQKTALDEIGKGLTDTWRKSTAAVNAERNLIKERMVELEERVYAPLAEYEAREGRRIKAHEDALAEIAGWSDIPADMPAADIAARIAGLDSSPLLTRDWGEFLERAREAMRLSVGALNTYREAATKREAEAAELERLRAEAADRARQEAARQQAEREAEIARQAAETARVAAEEAAARVAAETAAAAQREREAAAERERLAAEALAREQRQRREAEDRMERARVLRHETSISQIEDAAKGFGPDTPSSHIKGRIDSLHDGWGGAGADWQEFAERAAEARRDTHLALQALYEKAVEREEAAAEVERQEALRRAEFANAEAARRELAAAEAAATAERARAQREQAELERQAELRADNEAHRAQFNREAALDLQQRILLPDGHSLPKELAKAIVVAVARGQIRHIAISY